MAMTSNERYAEPERTDDQQIPPDFPQASVDPPLVRAAIENISPRLQAIMRAHYELSLEKGYSVLGTELAAALDMRTERVNRQLRTARAATLNAMVALVLARTGGSNCAELARELDRILSKEQHQTGQHLILNSKQSKVIYHHTRTCQICGPHANETHEHSKWALPAVLPLTSDDEERRRAAIAFFNRTDEGPIIPSPPAAVMSAVPQAGAISEKTATATRLIERLRDTVTSALTRMPGANTVMQFAQQDPDAFRRIAGAVIGGTAVITALVAAAVTISGGPSSADPTVPTSPTIAAPPPPHPATRTPPNNTNPGQPGTNPGQPGTNPGQPGTNPGQPGTNPGQPGTNPGQPSANPGGPGTSPGGPGTSPGGPPRSDNSQPPLESPAWGYASTREFQYNEEPGKQIELHPQWQWGTWRRSGDPTLAGRNATMTRTGDGLYRVHMPGLGPVAGVAHAELGATWGHQQATSCQIADMQQQGADQIVQVICFDFTGTRKNLPFLVVYVGASKGPTPMIAARYDGIRAVSATDRTVNVSRTGTGRYTVTTTGVFDGRGFVRITPVGTAPVHCRPAETTDTGSGLRIRVECDAPDGMARDTRWTLSYTQQVGMHHDPSVPAAYLATTGDPANPTIASDRSWSSNGETPTVSRGSTNSPNPPSTGIYWVQYQRIGKQQVYPAGAVAVTATGPQPRFCRNVVWDSYSFPGKVTIVIYCFDLTGRPADSTFALAYLRAP
jgi:hypothetical protein